MTPAYKGIGDIFGVPDIMPVGGGGVGTPGTATTGGGGSAQDGLGQIDTGSGTVRSALSTAASALGGAGGSSSPQPIYKKGGYVAKGGKINLGSGRISTASKNKNCSSW